MLNLVWVELERALLVGFGYFIVVGVGLEVKEVVEGYFGAFREGDLVAETEDFLVCGGVVSWWCELDWMRAMGKWRMRMGLGKERAHLLCSMRPPR